MKRGLLVRPPSEAHLERLYHELALAGASSVGRPRRWPYHPESLAQLLALAAEMLRYDPRLLSILLELVLARYREIDPMELRRGMAKMRWPEALLVLFDFAREASPEVELRYLADYLAAGHERLTTPERFFFDGDKPGSRMARRRAGRNLAPYGRWGFVGTERPTASTVTKRQIGRYDAATRAMLRRELAARGPFTLAEYLDAVDHGISRQRAYQELRADRALTLAGHGRGASWRARKRPAVSPTLRAPRRARRPAAGRRRRRSGARAARNAR